jgi:hypothetical protein
LLVEECGEAPKYLSVAALALLLVLEIDVTCHASNRFIPPGIHRRQS